MEIKIKLDNIDHESVIRMILPILMENADSISDKTLSGIVGMAKTMNISGDSIAKIISIIPKDVIDNIIVYFVNNHKDVVLNFAENITAKNGVKMEIKDIEISKD